MEAEGKRQGLEENPGTTSPVKTPTVPVHRPSRYWEQCWEGEVHQRQRHSLFGGLGPYRVWGTTEFPPPQPASSTTSCKRSPRPQGLPTLILAQASCVDSVPRRSLINMEPKYCVKEGEMLNPANLRAMTLP